MEYIGKTPLAPLMLVALGGIGIHAVAKGIMLVAFLWGKWGGKKTLKALFRGGPPFGGYLKIGADVCIFAVTIGLFYVVLKMTQSSPGAWEKTLASLWAENFWTKLWLIACLVAGVGLLLIKTADFFITAFSLKTYVEDAEAETPPVRKRLLFVTGLEFTLWQMVGWLGKIALFLARFIIGAGWAGWLMKKAVGGLTMPPEAFFQKFYDTNRSGTKGEKARIFLNYVVRFCAVRGVAVVFFALALW